MFKNSTALKDSIAAFIANKKQVSCIKVTFIYREQCVQCKHFLVIANVIVLARWGNTNKHIQNLEVFKVH